MLNHILYIILRNTSIISFLIFADKFWSGDDTRVCFIDLTARVCCDPGVCAVSVSCLDIVKVPVGQSHGNRSLEVFRHITVAAIDVDVVIRSIGVNLTTVKR